MPTYGQHDLNVAPLGSHPNPKNGHFAWEVLREWPCQGKLKNKFASCLPSFFVSKRTSANFQYVLLILGIMLAMLRLILAILGFILTILGPHLGHLQPHLGYLEPHLGLTLAILSHHLGHHGSHLGHLEPYLGHFGHHLGGGDGNNNNNN